MSGSLDDSREKVKDAPFTKKVAYTETTRGKGARALLIIFLVVSIGTSIPTIIYIMANPFLGSIANDKGQRVAFSDGKIFLQTAGGANGYEVYDNATSAQVGTRTKPGGQEYMTLYAQNNLVFGWSQDSQNLWVDYWGGSASTPDSSSISFNSNLRSVDVQGDYAYVGLQNQSVAIVNVSLAPSQSVSLVNCTAAVGFEVNQILISGDYIYH